MQNLRQKRMSTEQKYRDHMDKLYLDSRYLMANFVSLARIIKYRGGGIIFEWPTKKKLWKEDTVEQMIQDLQLTKESFNGCQLGLRTRKGKAICKPWTFATNVPCVVEMLKDFKRTRDHEHAVCAGDELKRTESYTPEMRDLLHLCMAGFVNNAPRPAAKGANNVSASSTQPSAQAAAPSSSSSGEDKVIIDTKSPEHVAFREYIEKDGIMGDFVRGVPQSLCAASPMGGGGALLPCHRRIYNGHGLRQRSTVATPCCPFAEACARKRTISLPHGKRRVDCSRKNYAFS
jgi:hypothetical protein